MAFKVAFVLALMVASGYCQNYLQQSRLYSSFGGGGSSLLLNQQYASTLTQHGFNNLAKSVHATGVWIFYEDDNFNYNIDAGVEYAIGYAPAGYLANFDFLGGKVSSARFVGASQDYRISTFTLYQYTWFQGNELFTTTDVTSVNVHIPTSGSFAITGRDLWTIYDQPNFKGIAYCVSPPSGPDYYTPGMLPDTQAPTSPVYIPYGSIRSIRKGCFGSLAAGGSETFRVNLTALAAAHGSNANVVRSVRPSSLEGVSEAFFVGSDQA